MFNDFSSCLQFSLHLSHSSLFIFHRQPFSDAVSSLICISWLFFSSGTAVSCGWGFQESVSIGACDLFYFVVFFLWLLSHWFWLGQDTLDGLFRFWTQHDAFKWIWDTVMFYNGTWTLNCKVGIKLFSHWEKANEFDFITMSLCFSKILLLWRQELSQCKPPQAPTHPQILHPLSDNCGRSAKWKSELAVWQQISGW